MSRLLLIVFVFLILLIPVYLLNRFLIPKIKRLFTTTSDDDVEDVLKANEDLGKKLQQEKEELQERNKKLSELKKKF